MRFFKITISLLVLFTSIEAYAQTSRRTELEEQSAKLQKEIRYINSLFLENKKVSKYSVAQVRNISKKINVRQSLIRNISGEIILIDENISKKNTEIKQLKQELESLKANYTQVINQAYKSRSKYSRTMFLLSSDNFNQANKRLKYIEQYTKYIKEQGEYIIKSKDELSLAIANLEQQKKEKLSLMSSKEKEKYNLEVEKEQKEKFVFVLKKKRKELLKDIKAKQRKTSRLQLEIRKIILSEIKKSREKAKKQNKETKYGLTAEAKILASKFRQNKKLLPWPVKRGVVTSRYGKHPHPTMKNIIIVNHGVDIATNRGASARAIFDGEVSSIIISKGGAKTVLVQHGNYYTVYSNLDKIDVVKGQKVKTKQKIGDIYTSSATGETVLKFQLWVDKNEENPSNWIYNMQ